MIAPPEIHAAEELELPVDVYLVNGICLKGLISSVDNDWVVFREGHDGKTLLINLHQVASISIRGGGSYE